MPRITQHEYKQIEAAFAEFEAGFHRSRRKNLWRNFEDQTLTVFQCQDGRFSWCVSGGRDDVRFSPEKYATEEEAMDSIAVAMLRHQFG